MSPLGGFIPCFSYPELSFPLPLLRIVAPEMGPLSFLGSSIASEFGTVTNSEQSRTNAGLRFDSFGATVPILAGNESSQCAL